MKWGCFCYCSPVDEDKEQPSVIKVGNTTKEHQWEVYSLKELLQATNNFHEDHKIGEGGFGSVYWGRTSKGDEIAVKRLKAVTMKAEMEFAVEVEILGRVRHKNLLGLRGFYVGGDERLIVYNFMPNHSLITHLHGHLAADVLLDWPRRMNIVLGSAEGLVFGILLLEIVSGKKPLEKLPGGIKRDIIQWVTPYVEKANYDDIVDPRLKGKFNGDELKNAVEIALRCTAKPEKRPSMIEVVDWLKNGIISTHKKEVMQVKDCLDVSEDQYTIEDYEDEEEDEDTDYERFQSRAKRNWDELKIRY
ncbi:hypothetical protein MKW92_036481 [Papaver armeniacum]|nr:hypothetical protein MKW92_036481 [Papaver armeniacum]